MPNPVPPNAGAAEDVATPNVPNPPAAAGCPNVVEPKAGAVAPGAGCPKAVEPKAGCCGVDPKVFVPNPPKAVDAVVAGVPKVEPKAGAEKKFSHIWKEKGI